MGQDTKYTRQINPGTVYTFALNRNAAMPVYPQVAERKLIDMPVSASAQQLQHGGLLYFQYCSICHGEIAAGGGNVPGLNYTTEATHRILNNILLEGLLASRGMPNFSGKLSERDIKDIQNYIFYSAKEKSMKDKKNK